MKKEPYSECLKSSNYSAYILYNLDFTLLWLIIYIAIVVLLKLIKKEGLFKFFMSLTFSYLDGGLIEFIVLTTSTFHGFINDLNVKTHFNNIILLLKIIEIN